MEQVAFINLSNREVITQPIPEELLRLYLGGAGLNAYLLYNHLPGGADPLSPDNVLIFGAGLMTGYPDVSTSRFNVTAKSPETGGYGTSNCGGFWGPELKQAGFQHLVIKGKASQPTYLWIDDGESEFRDASFLWGRDTYETQQLIMDDLGNPHVQIVTIGQAGENLVRFACVRHGLKRAAGRTGMGCVMGSKLLKAIVVKGTKGIKVAHPEQMLKVFSNHYRQVTSTKNYPVFSCYGTLFLFAVHNEGGHLTAYNHQYNGFEPAEGKLEAEIFEEGYKTKSLACFACPLHCTHRYRIKSGSYQGIWGEGPEYYTMGGFGSVIGNADWNLVLAANDLVNRYGLDVGSTSGYIAWLTELWQRGIIDQKNTGGLVLEWGNKEATLELIRQIAMNEGFGGMIGQEASQSSEVIGRGSGRYLYTNRGLMHESVINAKATRGTALAEATTNRGYDHLRGRCAPEFMGLSTEALEKIYGQPVASDFRSWEGKAWMAIWTQHFLTIADALGYCKFATPFLGTIHNLAYLEFSEAVNAAIGLDLSVEELMQIGERIWNLERRLNIRETGLGREGDRPPTFYYQPNKLEPLKGERLNPEEYGRALDEYYQIRGWSHQGVPTEETLARLKLADEPSHRL